MNFEIQSEILRLLALSRKRLASLRKEIRASCSDRLRFGSLSAREGPFLLCRYCSRSQVIELALQAR